MPKIAYIERKFSADSQALIDTCNQIITSYSLQGYRLTLRQLYYQLVSRNTIPNTERSYKRVGSIVNDARLAGQIDWSAIEDRGRNLQVLSHWSNPGDIINSAARGYRLDHWVGQPYRPEVWVEKAALEGVVSVVCNELDVPYFSCRGYNSQSEEWAAARRLQLYSSTGATPIIFYLGDHDPSGIDMTRDHIDRLRMFMGGARVDRLALNMNQVEQYNPPPNPAKQDDSRFKQYAEEHGSDSWELDALEPQVIAQLIRTAILDIRDDDLYLDIVAREKEEKSLLRATQARWREVVEYLTQYTDPNGEDE